jgi:ABC-type lipoprotein release transport system permease subunit
MRYFLEIARTGVSAIFLHRLRALVIIASLVLVLTPYLAGMGISRGLREQARASVRLGADLYVTGQQFGRTVPLPASAAEKLKAVPGVASVTPRIVGRIEIGSERLSAVVVGMPLNEFPPELECVEGRLFRGSKRNELVIGSGLASKLNLRVGSLIPPFYHSSRGEHVSEVVGIFRSDVAMWQARLIFTSLETAARIFDQAGFCTELLVNGLPGYGEGVRDAIVRISLSSSSGPIRLQAVSRGDLEELLPQGLQQREGIFTILYLSAFVVAILVTLITSALGQSEQRREIGILKAIGWQTDELLFRSLLENGLLSLGGCSLAVIAAFVWLRWFNGYGIAGIFVAGVDRMPDFAVPFRLAPVPALLGVLIALVIVLSGSLYATWRAAITPPRVAMR